MTGISTRGICSADHVIAFIKKDGELETAVKRVISDPDSFKRVVRKAANKDWCGECEDWERVRAAFT